MNRAIGSIGNLMSKAAYYRIVRFSSVQTRLTVFFAVILSLSIAVTSLVSYRQSSGAINGKIELYSKQVIEQIGANIELDIEHVQYAMDDIGTSDDFQDGLYGLKYKQGNPIVWNNQMNKEISHKLSLLHYVSTIIISVDSETTVGTFNSLDQEALGRIMEQSGDDRGFHYSPIYDKYGNPYIAISKSIHSSKSGEKLGTMVMTIEESHFMNLYKSIDLGPDAELFLLDGTGTVVSSRHKALLPVNRPMPGSERMQRELAGEGTQGENHYSDRVFGKESLISYAKVNVSGWTMVAVIPRAFIEAELVSLQKTMALIGSVCLLLSVVVAYFISLGISVPGKKLMETMRRVNDGELHVVIDDPNHDEMGSIARRFTEMIATLRGIIVRARSSAEEMSAQAQSTARMADQFQHNIQRFAVSIEQIAAGSGQQATEAGDGFANMNELSEKIDGIGASMNDIHTVMENIGELCGESRRTVDALNETTDKSNAISHAVSEHITYLNMELEKVKTIVEAITAFAKETNILAINAAIEASRAGSAGRSFAVVADEVKKLAARSRSSSEDIAGIIASVVERARKTAEEAGRSLRILEEQNVAVGRTGRTFDNIESAVQDVVGVVAAIRLSADEMIRSKERTLQSMEIISSVAQETAAVTSEANADSERHLQETERLSSMASAIEDLSAELSLSVSKFKV